MAYKESSFDGVVNASRYLESAALALGTVSLFTLHDHPRVEELASIAKSTDRLRKKLVTLMEEMKTDGT